MDITTGIIVEDRTDKTEDAHATFWGGDIEHREGMNPISMEKMYSSLCCNCRPYVVFFILTIYDELFETSESC